MKLQRVLWALGAFCFLCLTACGGSDQQGGAAARRAAAVETLPMAERVAAFEKNVDQFVALSKIPGMSAIVVQGDSVVWKKAYGFADVQNETAASTGTLFHVASITKSFAGVILSQLVAEGKLDWEDRVAEYGLDVPSTGILRIKHLVNHSAGGQIGENNLPPGQIFVYSGQNYAYLDLIMQKVTGQTFVELIKARILEPLGLESTVPNPMDTTVQRVVPDLDAAAIQGGLAQGYLLDSARNYQAVDYPAYFGAAAGLISNVEDLAVFLGALHSGKLLNAEQLAKVFKPGRSDANQPLPYGVGWFVQEYREVSLAWHYGLWTGVGSLIVTDPKSQTSVVLLANTANLNTAFSFKLSGCANLAGNPLGIAFVRHLLLPGTELPVIDYTADVATIEEQWKGVGFYDDLYAEEFWNYILLAEHMGNPERATELYGLYARLRKEAKSPQAWFGYYNQDVLEEPLPQETIDTYLGNYTFPEAGGLTAVVSVEEGKLKANTNDGGVFELSPVGPADFLVDGTQPVPWYLHFNVNEKGEVLGMEVYQPCGTLRAQKAKTNSFF